MIDRMKLIAILFTIVSLLSIYACSNDGLNSVDIFMMNKVNKLTTPLSPLGNRDNPLLTHIRENLDIR